MTGRRKRRGRAKETESTPGVEAGALPDAAGAYALVIELASPVAIDRPRRAVLSAGVYVYAGSARGPGGIRARVARHLRRVKPERWHVDRLTASPDAALSVIALPGGEECGIVAALVRHAHATVPVPGFGSSDCRSCPAHLLAIADAISADNNRHRDQGRRATASRPARQRRDLPPAVRGAGGPHPGRGTAIAISNMIDSSPSTVLTVFDIDSRTSRAALFER